MATTNYGVNHPLTVKLWARKLIHEALKETWLSRLIGEGSDSIVQMKTDLSREPGDRITMGLRMLLTGAGVAGDGTQEGEEESLVTYHQNIFINQLRHAVRSEGRMSEQRVPFSVREESRLGLQDWWTDRLDTWFINQVASNTSQTDTKFTGMQAATSATSVIIGGGETAEGSLSATTTHAISLRDLDVAAARAKTATPMIRPARVMGNSYYVAILHPFAVYQLRGQTSTAEWADIQKAVLQGGGIADNPLFTGAAGIYNNIIIHENTRLPTASGAGTPATYRRGVFLGAQSACMAFGGYSNGLSANWVEELFDYKNQLGVSGGIIGGLIKSRYNANDFAVIQMSGYAPSV